MRRLSLVLVLVAIGCRPQVHVHVYDDDDNDTDGEETDTASAEAGDPSDTNDAVTDSNGTNGDATDSSTPTTSTDSSDATSSTDTSSTDSSGGAPAEPYPQPVDGACPDGWGYNIDGNFEMCGPACDGDTCPGVTSGNVITSCVFNPESSMTDCLSGMCESEDEECFAGACMLPATHCAPLCSTMDAECPDGMECTTNEVCRFPT